MVKGRSDIYTRDHCYCTFRRKLHGFMVKYRDSEYSPLSFFLSSRFLSSSPTFFFISLTSPLLVILLSFFYFFLLALYYSISSFHIVQFISILLRCSLFVPFACDIASLTNWTKIMSARPLPLARPFRFPAYHGVTAHCAFLFRETNKARTDGILCTFVKIRRRRG